ncbi:MAG: hypothetical protein GXP44_00585 [bacterium]|nr:hypothetical protein [bacterium]
MYYLLEFVINPFISAIFTIAGGAIPLLFVLWGYSKFQHNRLKKFIPMYEKEVKEYTKFRNNAQKQYDQIVEKFGDIGNVIANEEMPSGDRENVTYAISTLHGDVIKFETKIISAKASISYIQKYNFWTVIEGLLRIKYISDNFLLNIK